MRIFRDVLIKAAKPVLFFSILAVILIIASNAIKMACLKNDNLIHNHNKSSFRILKEENNSIDMIVVGDSLSYSSISPMELWKKKGITAYVCGQPGQKIQETYYMLKTVFKKQSPKLVILETNVLFKKIPKGKIDILQNKLEEWGNYSFAILRGHDVWKSLVMDKEYIAEIYKGFYIRNAVKPYKNGEYMYETANKENISEEMSDYMEGILSLCRENGAQVLLLSTPSPANYGYERHNGIEEYAQTNKLDYLDMNLYINEMGINWNKDTLDKGDHLNLLGARKCTWYLGDYLKGKYGLTDHRGDENYISWQKESEEYKKRVKECLQKMKNHPKNN